MGIDNPQSIVLPEEIKKQMDSAKKQIAIFDAEMVNLQKTILAKEYSIRELLKQEEELKAKISELEDSVARGIEKKTEIDSINQILNKKNTILAESNSKLEEQIKAKGLLYARKEAEISDKEDNLKIEAEKLEQKRKELEQKETSLTSFAKEMKDLISKF
jgi:chromosome segregation ATPase